MIPKYLKDIFDRTKEILLLKFPWCNLSTHLLNLYLSISYIYMFDTNCSLLSHSHPIFDTATVKTVTACNDWYSNKINGVVKIEMETGKNTFQLAKIHSICFS